MEQEQTYQQVISKIENFNNQLSTLENGDDTEKLILEAVSEIENHFKTLLEAIQKRKEFVICSVTQLFQQLQQENELEKKELKSKIEDARTILVSGTLLYNTRSDASVMIWESAQKISHTKLEQKTIQVNLPPSLIVSIHSHGTAFIEDTIDKSFTRRQESIAYFKDASEKLEVYESQNKALLQEIHELKTNASEKLEAYESQNKALLQEIHKLKTRNQAFINRPLQFKAIVVSTLAGATEGYADGKGTIAKMNITVGVVFNPVDDCLYVCDYDNHSIRKVTKEGQVNKFVDTNRPGDITFSVKQQCFFVSEQRSHSIKKVTMKGESSILAGGKGIGYQDGEGKNAMFKWPSGIAVNEETGDVYVADYGNNAIRMITSEGKVTTLAGTAGNGGYSDGNSKSSLFNNPKGICFHSQYQALFVCDYYNNKLRRVSLNGQVSTVCEIIRPESVCILSNNVVLVSSFCQIFKVSFGENNKVETKVFAGSGGVGYKDGPPQESQFNWILGMAIDPTTNTCFVSDSGNHKIRTITY